MNEIQQNDVSDAERFLRTYVKNSRNTRLNFGDREAYLIISRNCLEKQIPRNHPCRQELADLIFNAAKDLDLNKLKFQIHESIQSITAKLQKLEKENTSLSLNAKLDLVNQAGIITEDLKSKIQQFMEKAGIEAAAGAEAATVYEYVEIYYELIIRLHLAISINPNFSTENRQQALQIIGKSLELIAICYNSDPQDVQMKQNKFEQFLSTAEHFIEQNLARLESNIYDPDIACTGEVLPYFGHIIEIAKKYSVISSDGINRLEAMHRKNRIRFMRIIINRNLTKLRRNELTPDEINQLSEDIRVFLQNQPDNLDPIEHNDQREPLMEIGNNNIYEYLRILQSCALSPDKQRQLSTNLLRSKKSNIEPDEINQCIENIRNLLRYQPEDLDVHVIEPNNLKNALSILTEVQAAFTKITLDQKLKKLMSNELNLHEKEQFIMDIRTFLQDHARKLGPDDIERKILTDVKKTLMEIIENEIKQNLRALRSYKLKPNEINQRIAYTENLLREIEDALNQEPILTDAYTHENKLEKSRKIFSIIKDLSSLEIKLSISDIMDENFGKKVQKVQKDLQENRNKNDDLQRRLDVINDVIRMINEAKERSGFLENHFDDLLTKIKSFEYTKFFSTLLMHMNKKQVIKVAEIIKYNLSSKEVGEILENIAAQDESIRQKLNDKYGIIFEEIAKNYVSMDHIPDRFEKLKPHLGPRIVSKVNSNIKQELQKSQELEQKISGNRRDIPPDYYNRISRFFQYQYKNLDTCGIDPDHPMRLELADHINKFMTITKDYIKKEFQIFTSADTAQDKKNQCKRNIRELLFQFKETLIMYPITGNVQHIQNELQNIRFICEIVFCLIDEDLKDLELKVLKSERQLYETRDILEHIEPLINYAKQHVNICDREALLVQESQFRKFQQFQDRLNATESIARKISDISNSVWSYYRDSMVEQVGQAQDSMISKLESVILDTDAEQLMLISKHVAHSYSGVQEIFLDDTFSKRHRIGELTTIQQRNLDNFRAGFFYGSGMKFDKAPGYGTLQTMTKQYERSDQILLPDDLRTITDRFMLGHPRDPNLPSLVERVTKHMNPENQLLILGSVVPYIMENINKYNSKGRCLVRSLDAKLDALCVKDLRNMAKQERNPNDIIPDDELEKICARLKRAYRSNCPDFYQRVEDLAKNMNLENALYILEFVMSLPIIHDDHKEKQALSHLKAKYQNLLETKYQILRAQVERETPIPEAVPEAMPETEAVLTAVPVAVLAAAEEAKVAVLAAAAAEAKAMPELTEQAYRAGSSMYQTQCM